MLYDVCGKEVIEELINRDILNVDQSMIEDKTLYCLIENDQIVACGGWSKRNKTFENPSNSKDMRSSNDSKSAGIIRTFYVRPDITRRGYGQKLLKYCEEEAKKEGFTKIELSTTLFAKKFYSTNGYLLESTCKAEMEELNLSYDYVKMYKYLD